MAQQYDDLAIYRAISIVTKYNEEKKNNQYEKYAKQNVTSWNKQYKIYNKNFNTYSREQREREYDKLKQSRPSQYDFSIANGNSTVIHYKSEEVVEAEKLLERVYSQIGTVLGRKGNRLCSRRWRPSRC